MNRKCRFAWRTALAFTLLMFTPWAFHADAGLEPNAACSRQAGANCVKELDSVCSAGSAPVWNHYNAGGG